MMHVSANGGRKVTALRVLLAGSAAWILILTAAPDAFAGNTANRPDLISTASDLMRATQPPQGSQAIDPRADALLRPAPNTTTAKEVIRSAIWRLHQPISKVALYYAGTRKLGDNLKLVAQGGGVDKGKTTENIVFSPSSLPSPIRFEQAQVLLVGVGSDTTDIAVQVVVSTSKPTIL